MSKVVFAAYQKMMLSMETLLLAFEIMETYEFKNFVLSELEFHKELDKRSCFLSVNRVILEFKDGD